MDLPAIIEYGIQIVDIKPNLSALGTSHFLLGNTVL